MPEVRGYEMSGKTALREKVIEKIIAEIHQKLPEKGRKEIDAFVQQYYTFVSEDDLKEHNTSNLYGAVLSNWHFINQRLPGEVKIRVFNPQHEQHGWQSKHTIVEVVSDDMPFLVDSIRMALVHKELNVHLLINPPVMHISRNEQGHLTHISAAHDKKGHAETIIHAEIDQQCTAATLQAIENELQKVIRDVQMVVEDWHPMTLKAKELIKTLKQAHLSDVTAEERNEVMDFIDWVEHDNFTF